VIELRLRGRRTKAPGSIVTPLVLAGLPVFLRWRGQPPFGEPELEQMLELCDRFIIDSGEWPQAPEAYHDLPFERTACSDIAWRRTEPWRRTLAGLWPGIADARELRVVGPLAEALLLAGWLRSRLERVIDLNHDRSEELESVAVDGEPCPVPHERTTPSDLLSAELDQFGRDSVYEEAVRAVR
jgi:glucose-6-phosphate dehydrogenase assembly protein OpcA